MEKLVWQVGLHSDAKACYLLLSPCGEKRIARQRLRNRSRCLFQYRMHQIGDTLTNIKSQARTDSQSRTGTKRASRSYLLSLRQKKISGSKVHVSALPPYDHPCSLASTSHPTSLQTSFLYHSSTSLSSTLATFCSEPNLMDGNGLVRTSRNSSSTLSPYIQVIRVR